MKLKYNIGDMIITKSKKIIIILGYHGKGRYEVSVRGMPGTQLINTKTLNDGKKV